MKELINKENAVKAVEKVVKEISESSGNILTVIWQTMQTVYQICNKLFGLIKKHPEFLKDVTGYIVDGINETAVKIYTRVMTDPILYKDLKNFVDEVEEMGDGMEVISSLLDKDKNESEDVSDSDLSSDSKFKEEAEYDIANNIWYEAEMKYNQTLRKEGPDSELTAAAFKKYTLAKNDRDIKRKKYFTAKEALEKRLAE